MSENNLNEPTTGEYTPDELIGAVRWCWINHENSGCHGCPLEHKPCDGLENALADCLERLNMENVDLCIDCGEMTETIASCRDTIESQERELSGIAGELEKFKAFHERYAEQTSEKYVNDICALTARAESAERERDAAIAVIGVQADRLKESHVVLCNICEFEDMIGCVHKSHCDGYQFFKYRCPNPQDKK